MTINLYFHNSLITLIGAWFIFVVIKKAIEILPF